MLEINYKVFLCVNLFAAIKIHFLLLKQKFLLQIELIGKINCDTFSVAPSIINGNKLEYSFLASLMFSIKARAYPSEKFSIAPL
jgi:hypothetical protein